MPESFELYIDASPGINRVNGRFLRGHVPFNKGLKWPDYMDARKAAVVKKNLDLGRKAGNKHLAGSNKKPVVAMRDNKLISFKSAIDAQRILRSRGIKVNKNNINSVCNEKVELVGGEYQYTRKRAGGFRWFFADDVEKYKDLLK